MSYQTKMYPIIFLSILIIYSVYCSKFTLICGSNCHNSSQIDAHKDIEISAMCWDGCGSTFKFEWKLESKPENIKQNFTAQDTAGSNTSFLTIYAYTFRCGEIYDLVVSITYSGGTKEIVTEIGMQKCSRRKPPGEEDYGTQLEYEYTDFSYLELTEEDKNLTKSKMWTKFKEQRALFLSMYNKTNTNVLDLQIMKAFQILILWATNNKLGKGECKDAVKYANELINLSKRWREPLVKAALQVTAEAAENMYSHVRERSNQHTSSSEDTQYQQFFEDCGLPGRGHHYKLFDFLADHRKETTDIPGYDQDYIKVSHYSDYEFHDFDLIHRQRRKTYQDIMFLRLRILKAIAKAHSKNVYAVYTNCFYGRIRTEHFIPWNARDRWYSMYVCYRGDSINQVTRLASRWPNYALINAKENFLFKPIDYYYYVYHSMGYWINPYEYLDNRIEYHFRVDYRFYLCDSQEGFFQMPWDHDIEDVRNDDLGIHKIDVHVHMVAIAVRVSINRLFKICVKKGRHPTIADFNEEPDFYGGHNIDKQNRFYAIKAEPGDVLYLAILPTAQHREKAKYKKGYRVINYNIQMLSVQCIFVDEDTREEIEGYCRIDGEYWDIENYNRHFICTCNRYGLYEVSNVPLKSRFLGFKYREPPKPLPPYSYIVAITSGAVVSFILFLCICKGIFGRNTQIIKTVKFLMDNNLDHEHPYIIVVTTQSSTTANIAFRLHGSLNSTPEHLFRGQSEPALQYKTDDYFYLLSEKDLGDLQSIELWSDCYGFKPTWLCSKIKVINYTTNEEWLFQINDWLTPIDRKHVTTVYIDNPEVVYYFQNHVYALEGLSNHLWIKTFTKLQNPIFTFCERINVLLTIFILNMLLTLLLLKIPNYNKEFWYFGYTWVKIGWFEVLCGCGSGFVSFLIATLLIYCFSRSKRFGTGNKLDDVKHGSGCRVGGWLLMVFLQLAGLGVVNMFGIFMDWNNSLVWLYTWPIGLSICILGECLRAMIEGCNTKKIIPQILTIDYKSIEYQKDKVLRGLGKTGMRPLLQKYYNKLSDADVRKLEVFAKDLQYRKCERDELVMYIGYMVILLLMVLYYRDSLAYISANNIRDVFIEDKCFRKLPLKEINSQKSFLRYLREVFLPAIHATNWYGLYDSRAKGRLKDFASRMIGAAQIRQIRIKNGTCTVPHEVSSFVNNCHAEYNIFRHDYGDYAEFWEPYDFASEALLPSWKVVRLDSAKSWFYKSWLKTKALPFNGEFAVYPGGGYTIEFGREYKYSRIIHRYLRETNWIDPLTRALFLSVNLYNANDNLFNFLTIVVEQSATGAFVTNYQLNTVQFFYRGYIFWIVFPIFIVLLCLFCLLFIWQMYYQFKAFHNSNCKSFLSDFWNWIDPLIIVLIFSLIFMFVVKYLVTEYIFQTDRLNSNYYESYSDIIICHNLLEIIAALLVGVSTLRLWKLLRFLRAFRLLELTLAFSSGKLLVMVVLNFLLIMVYAGAGFLLLGPYVKEFRTVWSSFVALILISFGLEFNLGLELGHQTMYFYSGILYFAGYLILVLVLLNIFITIIVVSYNNAKVYFDHMPKQRYSLWEYFRDDCLYKCDKYNGRIRNVAILRNINQALKDLRLRAGQDPVSRNLDTNTNTVLLNSQRTLEMHQLTDKAATLILDGVGYTDQQRHEQALRVLGHFYYRFAHDTPQNTSQHDEYVVVPDGEEMAYISLERQKQIKTIVDYLMNQSERKSPQWIFENKQLIEQQLRQVHKLRGQTEEMIELIKKLLAEGCTEKTTQLAFADLGLEEWVTPDVSDAPTSEEFDIEVVDGNIQITYRCK